MRLYYAGNGGRMEELMQPHEPTPTERWGVLVSYLDITPSRMRRIKRAKKHFNKKHRKINKKPAHHIQSKPLSSFTPKLR